MKRKLSKLINKNNSSLVRIDPELHRLLKIKAATEKVTIKALLEGCLAELLEVKQLDLSKFGNSPTQVIDSSRNSGFDRKASK